MPHRCQQCENIIPDESDNLLEGCPDCGNQSWEYVEPQKENRTQQEARTEFIDKDELPTSSAANSLQNPTGSAEDEVNETSGKQSVRRVESIEKVREQLNRQYEGIKVVEQGRFEINLTELYRGNEYVIEVGSDGAYEVSRATRE